MANRGFRYQPDMHATLDPWRQKLGEQYEQVVALLIDRDRALEDYVNQIIYDRVNSLVTFAGGETINLGAWLTYSLVLTNVGIGNGTITALYYRSGRTIVCRGRVTFGSSTTITGPIIIGLPVAARDTAFVGSFYGLDAGIQHYSGAVVANSTNDVLAVLPVGATGPAAPFGWGPGDSFIWDVTYEAAS